MSVVRRQAAYHHGDLHDAAVDVALAALDGGRELPPLRAIAGRCGVSHTALYRHFDGLDGLALAVGTRCYADLAVAIHRASGRARTATAGFRACGRAYIRWGLAHPGRYRFMTSAVLAGRQDDAAFLAAASAAFAPLVRAVAAVGVADPLPVAHTIFCATHGLVDLTVKGRTIPGRAAPIATQVRELLDALERYARSRAGGNGPD